MNILAIETSCDETAVSIIHADGDIGEATFTVRGNALYSQVAVHKQYGGVFPALAKREHAQNLGPLLQAALTEAELFKESPHELTNDQLHLIERLLSREPQLARNLAQLFEQIEKPDIDVIAVTTGPGLEPALWVGVNAARTLALIWDLPVIPTNHLEGHIVSSLVKQIDDVTFVAKDVTFPILGFIISGAHTEFFHITDWHSYELIGSTRDDAVGEAFDKVGRMLDLPYPGGVHIARLAEEARSEDLDSPFEFPRPMLGSDDLDFSFSGLKTAVMYAVKKWKAENGDLTDEVKKQVALSFEEAVRDVLVGKVRGALEATEAKMLVIGGGVSANSRLREDFTLLIQERFPEVSLSFSNPKIATDNAIMIGMAGAMRVEDAIHPGDHEFDEIAVFGNKAGKERRIAQK